MTYEEYVARQAQINESLRRVLAVILAPYRAVALTPRMWRALVALLYPIVARARREASILAREFYDSERAKHFRLPKPPRRREGFNLDIDVDFPEFDDIQSGEILDRIPDFIVPSDDSRFDVPLVHYEPDWFLEALEPARSGAVKPNSTPAEMEKIIDRAEKEVENGGRRQVLYAVDNDPQVIGWARVQGGNESCAFCLTLISRGPVYKSARSAGLNVDDKASAVELYRQIDAGGPGAEEAYNALMNRWHPNCDCKVVPVFDRANWSGRESYEAALEIWKRVTRGYSGTDKINALRRYLEKGTPDYEELKRIAA